MMTVATHAPLKVVEASRGIGGAYCGWLLREMGAEVVRIGTAPEGSDPIGMALAYYASRKTEIHVSEAAAAIASADIVITDDAAWLAEMCGRSLDDLAAAQPETVFGVTSVFGLTGPLADIAAVPLNAQAQSSVAWALGEPGRPPLAIPPGVLECQAGAHLAAAALMARLVGPDGKSARIVDIALHDVLTHYVGVNCRFYIHHGMTWRRAGRRASDSGGAYPFVILPCKDGAVCLSGRTRAEWQRFVEAMGTPAWSQEPRYQKLRAMGQQYPDEVDALVMPWQIGRAHV